MSSFQGDSTKLAEFANERQGKRLLRMSFPRQPGPKGALMLVNKLDCTESMSRGWRCQLEVLSDSARIRLRELSGKMVTVSMVRDDGTLRHFNGYVHEFAFVKTDGGFAYYRMVLLPWLADLALRSDCATFMNMGTGELLRNIFDNYDRRDFMTRIVDPDPDVTMRIQYNESDYNHLHRRLEADGWHTWIEHFADHHTVWIGDDSTQAAPIDGARPEMVFRGESGSAEADGIARWSPSRRVGAALAGVGSYDFKCADGAFGERWSQNPRGALPDYEAFESAGAYGFRQDGRAGEELARLRMEERDARGLYFHAGGNERRAQPGRWFTLAGHFSGERRPYQASDPIPPGRPDNPAERQYLILSVRHQASNNYHVGAGAPSSYSNTFTCVRKNIPWRPGRGYHSRDTRIAGPQTALVVGPSNEQIFTDSHGRVCVRFHWDRESKRKRDMSAWVRVMTPWAGDHFGQISLPRINDEVVVVFLDGNCDRPLIIGSAYNASRMPPWELPANKTQSGILSRSTPNGTKADANSLRFEDRSGKNGVQLNSSHERSELNLGWLAQPNSPEPRDPRGEGAELRSDEHIALRGGKGILLSAWQRAGSGDNQLARDEYLTLLQECFELLRSLGKYAGEHQALPIDEKGQETLLGSMQRWENGSNTAPQGRDGGAPVIAVTAPAGLSFATPQSIVSYAGANLDAVAQINLQMTAGQRYNVNAGNGISLFSHSDGIKAIAHYGKFVMQSQHDDLEINSAKNVRVTASDGTVVVMAKQLQLIAEDGSFIKIGGGITLGTNGDIKNQAANFPFSGPATMHTELPTFDSGQADQKFVLKYGAHLDGAVIAPNRKFEIDMSDGSTAKGISDAEGKTHLLQRDAMHIAKVRIVTDDK